MKILMNDRIFVQIKDIAFLIHVFPYISQDCPKQLLKKCFSKVLICNEENKYNFIEFNDIEEIEFLDSLNFIVNYYDYESLDFKEIIRNIENIGNELNNIVDKYQDLDKKTQEKQYDKFTYLFELKYYRMNSIREIYKIKAGELKVDLPVIEEKSILKEKGLKKYINKIFKNRKD